MKDPDSDEAVPYSGWKDQWEYGDQTWRWAPVPWWVVRKEFWWAQVKCGWDQGEDRLNTDHANSHWKQCWRYWHPVQEEVWRTTISATVHHCPESFVRIFKCFDLSTVPQCIIASFIQVRDEIGTVLKWKHLKILTKDFEINALKGQHSIADGSLGQLRWDRRDAHIALARQP